MTTSYLIVPIKLDALKLETPETVQSEMADFSNLPWCSGEMDYQSGSPYLGDALVKPPFQNKNLTLSSGTHLHWTLPVAHRTSASSNDKIEFPAAPNRWLITRTANGLKNQWIVESDYISATTNHTNTGAITVPVTLSNVNSNITQPYLYLGRQLTLAEWQSEDKTALSNSYWQQVQGTPLTAMGYGELSFNTFYPNCRSVFGFFDHESVSGASYEVLGWYSDVQNDILNGVTSVADILAQLNWQVSGSTCPNTSLYYASITADGCQNRSTPPALTQVAVGNTGTEALSAYLASSLSQENKTTIEEQLEAILMGNKAVSVVDPGAVFEQNRHQKSFASETGGNLWTLKATPLSQSQSQTQAQTGGDSDVETDPVLSPELAGLLNDLNQAQHAYNQAQGDLHSAQFQLYSDWYKYLMCCYPPDTATGNFPDVDQIRLFIQMNSLPKVTQLQNALGQLTINQGSTVTVSATDTLSHAGLVVAAFNKLNTAVTTANASSSGQCYEISTIPGPSYYEPADPVVLFAGDASSSPYLEEVSSGPLSCLPGNGLTTASTGVPVALSDVTSLVTASDIASSFSVSSSSWHPQLLEWLVSFFPVTPQSNVGSADAQYQTDYTTHNFALNEDCFDFTQQQNTAQVACEYSGSTYVSANTSSHFSSALQAYLLQRYPQLDPDNFSTSLGNVWTLYPSETQDYSNPGYTAVKAYEQLATQFILTQSLGGFNLALLQHTHNLSIPIADPLGFSQYQAFSQNVAAALQGAYTAAPDPNGLFMPIRSGNLSFGELAISDHFGQVNLAQLDSIIASNPLSIANNDQQCWLSPRLAQASRLNFNLLAAETLPNGAQLEMNSHPTTNPVCGWLMLNYLDNSLVFYNAAGANLGSFNQSGQWQQTPGAVNPVSSSDLVSTNPANLNSHLLNLLMYIVNTVQNNSSFINDLVTAMQGAQANIAPESYAGNDAISLLMGKPIAIVRSQLSLECKGSMAVDQGWTALRSSIEQGTRSSASFQDVQFPVRLGEYRQLNDGLIGYFVEDGNQTQPGANYKDDIFYINDSKQASFDSTGLSEALTTASINDESAVLALLNNQPGTVKRQDFANQIPGGGEIFDQLVADKVLTLLTPSDTNIQYYSEAGLIKQSLTSAPVETTMLVDPHGLIHATTGILPIQSVQIPAEFFTDALKNININFFTAPILTPTQRLQMSLPKEAGKQWDWIQNTGSAQSPTWSTTPNVPVISVADFNTAWSAFAASQPTGVTLPGTSPWQELLSKGWLQQLPNSSDWYQVVAANITSHEPLVTWSAYSTDISNLISANTQGITAFPNSADFTSEQHILEGWLQLS